MSHFRELTSCIKVPVSHFHTFASYFTKPTLPFACVPADHQPTSSAVHSAPSAQQPGFVIQVTAHAGAQPPAFVRPSSTENRFSIG